MNGAGMSPTAGPATVGKETAGKRIGMTALGTIVIGMPTLGKTKTRMGLGITPRKNGKTKKETKGGLKSHGHQIEANPQAQHPLAHNPLVPSCGATVKEDGIHNKTTVGPRTKAGPMTKVGLMQSKVRPTKRPKGHPNKGKGAKRDSELPILSQDAN